MAEAINQPQALAGRGTKKAAGARITALKPSIKARRDILSSPALRMALTTACANPETRMSTEAVFSRL
jgi:hypothetical protein